VHERVLVVEDDEATRRAVRALLDDAGYHSDGASDGVAGLARVREGGFDLLLLDLMLPRMSGAEVHRAVRRDPRTRFLPVVFLTAEATRAAKVAQLEAGADDFITKPYDSEELLARIGAAVRRASGLRALNPLSGLPGNTTITEEIESRIAGGTPFALMYADIDRFKEFNDYYGFARGDRMITRVAELIDELTRGNRDRFVGHIGGDDFVFMASSEDAEPLATRIAGRFEETVATLYDREDRERGYLQVRNRQGRQVRIPLATVSIGIVNVAPGRFDGAISAARAAAEMKSVAKRQPGSTWAVDRRKS
jgi:diguanylate cyclase (GGDEF)-like protein